jgi:rhodanese-related sulfurtransferase
MDLSQSEWAEKLAEDSNAVILDVRTGYEYAEGYIPNAVPIDIMNGAKFIDSAKELDSSKNYYVYCKSGGRSAQACMIMKSLGIETAYNLVGGFTNWQGEKTL